MNRYEGNTGRFIYMPEPELPPRPRRSPPPASAERRPPEPERREPERPKRLASSAPAGQGAVRAGAKGPPPKTGGGPEGPLGGIFPALNSLLGRMNIANLETEDLLLMLILYLMYRESGDRELLIIMAAMLFV